MLMLLVVLGCFIAIVLVALLNMIHLFRTCNGKCADDDGEARLWSNRLYSASKRAALAWTAEILFCAVVYIGFGWYDEQCLPEQYYLWIMVALPIASFAWGLARPRVYKDGAEREKNGRGQAWFTLAVLLFPIFIVTFAVSHSVATCLHGRRDVKERIIRADEWSAWKFRMADVAPEIIPPGATDIELAYRPCALFCLGGHATLRCNVERDDLLAFAKTRGYEFQPESIERNACSGGCGDCDFIGESWRKYNGDAEYPVDFLAFNYRRATCGGHSFLYDVTNKTLYAEWSSN